MHPEILKIYQFVTAVLTVFGFTRPVRLLLRDIRYFCVTPGDGTLTEHSQTSEWGRVPFHIHIHSHVHHHHCPDKHEATRRDANRRRACVHPLHSMIRLDIDHRSCILPTLCRGKGLNVQHARLQGSMPLPVPNLNIIALVLRNATAPFRDGPLCQLIERTQQSSCRVRLIFAQPVAGMQRGLPCGPCHTWTPIWLCRNFELQFGSRSSFLCGASLYDL